MSKSTLSRRIILAGTATSLPALAAPTAAFASDPVFAAIERYPAAQKVHVAACKNEPDFGHPDKPAWEARQSAACGAEWEAFHAMFEIRPTTKVGAVAMLEACRDYAKDCLVEDTHILLQTLIEAIPGLA